MFNLAKPDNRADNVEKLQQLIHDTQENYREAKDYLKAHNGEMSSKEQAQIQEKNEKRLDAIRGFRSEIQDEVKDQQDYNPLS